MGTVRAALEDDPNTHTVPIRRVVSATHGQRPLASGGAWVNVRSDEVSALRRAVGSHDGEAQTMSLSAAGYQAMMGVGRRGPQGPQRRGLHQRVYGWLAFPGGWWPVGDIVDTEVLFAREQTYPVLPGRA